MATATLVEHRTFENSMSRCTSHCFSSPPEKKNFSSSNASRLLVLPLGIIQPTGATHDFKKLTSTLEGPSRIEILQGIKEKKKM